MIWTTLAPELSATVNRAAVGNPRVCFPGKPWTISWHPLVLDDAERDGLGEWTALHDLDTVTDLNAADAGRKVGGE